MSTIITLVVGGIVLLWVLWNAVYLLTRGAEETRFFEVSTGRWGK